MREWRRNVTKPMLAKKTELGIVPQGHFLYEYKWDGIRAIIDLTGDKHRIFSRQGREITQQYPELNVDNFLIMSGTFDAEIVVFDEYQVSDFALATSRLHLGNTMKRQMGAVENPVTVMLFDILEYNGNDVTSLPIEERKHMLEGSFERTQYWRYSKHFSNGDDLYAECKARGLEGIMAKRTGSPYLEGRRTKDWLKVKIMYEEVVRVIGFTIGLGKRDTTFGALIVESLDGEPIGRVGTGFTDDELGKITDRLVKCGVLRTHRDEVYLKRKFNVKVRGMKKNKSGAIREPVYLGLA